MAGSIVELQLYADALRVLGSLERFGVGAGERRRVGQKQFECGEGLPFGANIDFVDQIGAGVGAELATTVIEVPARERRGFAQLVIR